VLFLHSGDVRFLHSDERRSLHSGCLKVIFSFRPGGKEFSLAKMQRLPSRQHARIA
jgi:hypothetical protein